MDNKIDIMLNKTIKVLLVTITCIMLIIGMIFILPVNVHAVDQVNYLEIYKHDINDFRINYSYPNLTFLNSSASAYGEFSLTNQFSVSSGDILTLYCNDVYPNTNCTIVIYAGTSILQTFKLNEIRSLEYTFTNSYNNISLRIQNYTFSVDSYPYTLDITQYFSVVPLSNYLSYNNTLTIEPGYVAYCLCEGGSVVLNTIMPLNSNLNIAGKPKWDSMARIAFGVQRPESGTVLTDSFGNLINWQKNGTAPSNILGMTKYAQAIYNDLPADGSFVAIYNPAYYGDDMSNPTQAPSITASFTNLGAVAKYPINTQVAYTPALGWNIQSGSDSDWSEYGIAVPTTDGAINTSDYIMSTTSEPAIVFPDGGYNDSNAVNNDTGSVLQRIIQPIINLLKAPYEHINNLISQGNAFMREIGQFFNWLPDPVMTFIIDALIVCVVVGVLKLLF